jgi:hypothetical protein
MLNKLSNVVSAACLLLLSAVCFAQLAHQANSTPENSLRKFLQDYVGDSDDKETTRYDSAFVDLKDDGAKEAIVYLSGDGWCGSGGCTTLVLAPAGSSYRVVAKITITRPPIRVLTSKSNGWHNISVLVGGGGPQPGYEAELRFDGNSYPINPSTPPARRLAGKGAGEVVVPHDGEGKPLYQHQ